MDGTNLMPDESLLVEAVRELRKTIEKFEAIIVRKDVYYAERETDRKEVHNIAQDVSEIKDTMKWLSRAIITAIAFPLVLSLVLLYVTQSVS